MALPTASANWPEIRRDFVEGLRDAEGNVTWPTLRELAKRWKVSFAAIESQADRGKWLEARDTNKIVAEEAARRERFMDIARRAVAFDEKAFTVANALLTFAQNRLAIHAQQQTIPTVREMRELAEVALKAQHVGRLAVGESTENFRNLDRLPPFKFVIQGSRATIPQDEA